MKLYHVLPNIHRVGWPFIGLAAAAWLALSLFGWPGFIVGMILCAWCVYFFRDPDRVTPIRDSLIVSPADGRIVAVTEVIPEESIGVPCEKCWRISIFLDVFDVHVNRAPANGEVVSVNYRAGKFFNASLDKASIDNERAAVALRLSGNHSYNGKLLGVVQIAGLIARRIVCYAAAGHRWQAGERYGIIRFGSRADIYLPTGLHPLVTVGQYMIGGETILADCASNEETRQGEKR